MKTLLLSLILSSVAFAADSSAYLSLENKDLKFEQVQMEKITAVMIFKEFDESYLKKNNCTESVNNKVAKNFRAFTKANIEKSGTTFRIERSKINKLFETEYNSIKTAYCKPAK